MPRPSQPHHSHSPHSSFPSYLHSATGNAGVWLCARRSPRPRRGYASAPVSTSARRAGWRRASCRPTSSSCRRRRVRLPALLRAQPEAVPAARGDRRRVAPAGDARARRRSAHRPPALSRLPRRRARRRADRPAPLLARRPGGFLLGCSFTFEWALPPPGCRCGTSEQGVTSRCTVTNRRCVARRARSTGPLVVSMRPLPPSDVRSAPSRSSARFPAMHGAPVHVGDPAALGIADSHAPTSAIRCDSARRGSRLLGVRRDAAGRRTRGAAVAGNLPRARAHVHHRSAAQRLRPSRRTRPMTIHDRTSRDQHRDADPDVRP